MAGFEPGPLRIWLATCIVLGLPLGSVLHQDIGPGPVEHRPFGLGHRVLRDVVVVVVMPRGRNVKAGEEAVEDVAEDCQGRHHDEVDKA